MNEFILGQIVGFGIGILSSFVFWYYMLTLKPRLELEPVITYSPNDYKFRLNFSNKGWRQIINLEAKLTFVERLSRADTLEPSTNRRIIKRTYNLNRSTITAIESKRNRPSTWSIPNRIILSTVPTDDDLNLNLDEMFKPTDINGERRFVVTVTATDALSGTTVAREITFSREKVVYGRFGGQNIVNEEIPPYLPKQNKKTSKKLSKK